MAKVMAIFVNTSRIQSVHRVIKGLRASLFYGFKVMQSTKMQMQKNSLCLDNCNL